MTETLGTYSATLPSGAGALPLAAGLRTIANYLEDDWGDGALTSRTDPSDDAFAHPAAGEAGDVLIGRYRPDWTVASGSPSVVNQEVEFPNGGTTKQEIRTPSTFAIGSWQIDFRLTSTSSNGLKWAFFVVTPDSGEAGTADGYWIDIVNTSSGGFNLYEESGNTYTKILGGAHSGGTSTQSGEVSRDTYGNFETFANGSSQGTVTDTTHTDPMLYAVSNSLDGKAYVDNLVVS